MKLIKQVLFGVILGMILGLWFGVNIGKQQPILSNPFAQQDLQRSLRASGDKLLQKGGDALEKSGQALKQQIKQ